MAACLGFSAGGGQGSVCWGGLCGLMLACLCWGVWWWGFRGVVGWGFGEVCGGGFGLDGVDVLVCGGDEGAGGPGWGNAYGGSAGVGREPGGGVPEVPA